MQCYVDCVHCYLKQAANCMSIAGVEEDRQYQVLYNLMEDIKNMDRHRTPAENSTELLMKVYQAIGCSDPYRQAKDMSNRQALKLLPGLEEHLRGSSDRLFEALKIAVAGNVIDLGINKDFDIGESLRHCLGTGFARDDYHRFRERLGQTREVLIAGDNAGEIVFDRLLVEELLAMGKEVTYLVKGGPVLNDATMEDAVQAGLDKVARVITTGSNYLGVPPGKISPPARTALEQAGLVISKGQANFETLEHKELARGRIFFLLKIKCACVGRVAGAHFGNIVFFTR